MLRVIDTETCDLQGGIVEVASVDVVDGKIVNPMSHLVQPSGDGYPSHYRIDGGGQAVDRGDHSPLLR